MEYKLIRQKRKTIAISINEKGQIIVKAPIKTSINKIEAFIQEKQHWIEKHLKKVEGVKSFEGNFDFKNNAYILGKEYKLQEIDICFPKAEDRGFQNKLHNLYLSLAEQKLPKMVEEISSGLKYNSIKLCNSKRIWGSFDRNYNMKLNWRLIMLPEELVNYVIIHELCHGLELNHSQAFWKEVSVHCQNYKTIKKQLELYSFLLQFNI